MSTHNMFLWRIIENYPSIIIKYPPYSLSALLEVYIQISVWAEYYGIRKPMKSYTVNGQSKGMTLYGDKGHKPNKSPKVIFASPNLVRLCTIHK